MKKTKVIIIFIGIIFLATPLFVSAGFLGQKVNFFIDSEFDLEKREQVTATLQKISPKLYFYIEDGWWVEQNTEQRAEIKKSLISLAEEFEEKIYPKLTNTFGSELKPGIDRDERIIILIHEMHPKIGGYFNSADGYLKIQAPRSNEREMIYLNTFRIAHPNIKSILAHEFVHLITFHQKDIIHRVSEEIWLNDIRAEYVSTLLDYDDDYHGSSLENRVRVFLAHPNDSLTEWLERTSDYGVVNLFAQYLVDHYGIEILVDSLKSSKVGIPSINYALRKNGFEKDFSQIFTNWKIALLVNNCDLGPKYCYLNAHLSKLRIIPLTNFLPFVGQGTLAVTHTTKNWSTNWHRFIGGRGVLKVEFNGYDRVNFKVPYVLEDLDGNMTIGFLELDGRQDGEIYVADFNAKNRALTILPSIQDKISGFNGEERSFSFSWTASIVERTPEQEAELKKQLLTQISILQKEIARIQAQLNELLAKKAIRSRIPTGFQFEKNLFFGMTDQDVVYLKIILEKEVSPRNWLGNNYFGSETLAAVRAFQKKYKNEISQFAGRQISATGFVGRGTRAKLNQLISR